MSLDPVPSLESATGKLFSRRRIVGLGAALTAGSLMLLLPEPAGLTPEGKRMAAIFVIALILWATEVVPIAVTSLLVLILQPMLRVENLQTAFNTFISPVFFFVIAMFCIAQAFITTGLDRRFALWLLSLAGTDSRRVLLALMVGTATISTIVSDVPVAAIFMSITLGILSKTGISPGSSNFGKTAMMGVSIASLIGGVGTPAGSAINVIGLYFIEQYGKVKIPFLYWMAIGIPMVVILIPTAWWVLLRFYPPEFATIGQEVEISDEQRKIGPLTGAEIKVIVILSTMLLLWILSTWIRRLDVVLIALAGAVVMFLPGVNLFTWKQVEKGTAWDALLVIGSVTSLGAASAKTGLAKWLVDVSIGGIQDWNLVWIVAMISAFTVLIHLIVPVGPAINAVLVPPIALLALSTGHNPALYALPVAFTASCNFLLPLDAPLLITYSKGYYRMLDMLLPGAVISICWIVLMTLLMLLLGPLLGLV